MVSEEEDFLEQLIQFEELSPVLFSIPPPPRSSPNSPSAAAVVSPESNPIPMPQVTYSPSAAVVLLESHSHSHFHFLHHLATLPVASSLTGPCPFPFSLLSLALPTPPIAFLKSPTKAPRFSHKSHIPKNPVGKIPLQKAAPQCLPWEPIRGMHRLQWRSARSFGFGDGDQNRARKSERYQHQSPRPQQKREEGSLK